MLSREPFIICGNFGREAKKIQKRFITGKGLNAIEPKTEKTPSGLKASFVSHNALEKAKFILPAISCLLKEVLQNGEDKIDMKYIKARYAVQDKNLIYLLATFMSTLTDLIFYIEKNHEMLIQDIESGTINDSIEIPKEIKEKLERKLKPNPKRASELREIFETHKDEPIVPRLWNKMSLIIAIATGDFAPYDEKMRKYCGEKIPFSYCMYGASEACIATTMNVGEKSTLIIPNNGFYEFIPEDDDNAKPLLINELQVGKNYEIIATTLNGLYRYKLNDVIKVTGFINEMPMIQFVYRKGQVVNIDAVHITMEHVAYALENVSKEMNINIVEYSLYPDTESVPPRLILFLELEQEISEEQEYIISKIFDEKLGEANYEHKRMLKVGDSINTVVHIVKKGAYQKYREIKSQNKGAENQLKAIRYINTAEKLKYLEEAIVIRGSV